MRRLLMILLLACAISPVDAQKVRVDFDHACDFSRYQTYAWALSPKVDFLNQLMQSRLIGFIELLGAAGLILPGVTHIAPIVVPLAAIGLVLVMVGAAIVHARRHEAMNIAVNVVLLALAAFVAWGRFGPYPFTA